MATKLKSLRLNEVSLVDRGANQHAHITLFKRDGEPIRKRLTIRKDGAIDFDAALTADEVQEGAFDLPDEVCEAVQALHSSVYSIIGDADVSDKSAAIAESLTQFSEHLAGLKPEEMEKALTAGQAIIKAALSGVLKGDTAMTEEEKKLADAAKAEAEKTKKSLDDLTKSVAMLKRENAILKMSDAHSQYMADAEMDDGEKDNFAAKTPAERDAHIDKNPIEKRLPASVQKALDAAAADRAILKSLQEKDEVSTFGKRAASLGLPESMGDTLRKAYRGDTEAIGNLETAIKGLTEQVKTGKVFAEFGTSHAATDSAVSKMKAEVADLRKRDTSIKTDDSAIAKIATDPAKRDLWNAYKAETSGQRAA